MRRPWSMTINLERCLHAKTLRERRAVLERWVFIAVVELVERSELEGGMAVSGLLGLVLEVLGGRGGRAGVEVVFCEDRLRGRGRRPGCEGGDHGEGWW